MFAQSTTPARPAARKRVALWALLLALLTLLSACSGADETSNVSFEESGDDTSTDAEEPTMLDTDDGDMEEESMEAGEGEAMADEEVALPAAGSQDDAAVNPDQAEPTDESEPTEEGEGELGAGGAAATQQSAADLGRKIIFNATITVEVDNVASASEEATEIIAGFDGFVYGQETTTGEGATTTITFKVLPDDFGPAVEALGTVGDLRDQIITADDVTERIVNLETRIEVAELGVERLRATLTATTNLDDYAELERLLLERESELEIMRAQVRNLSNQVNLATITLTLTQERVNHGIEVAASVYQAHDDGQSCPGDDTRIDRVEEGAELTVCYEIVNVGDEPLLDVTLIDAGLGVEGTDDLIEVFGDETRLEAGQTLILAKQLTVERTLNLRSKITARPANPEGEVTGPSIDATIDRRFDVTQGDQEPGFTDGFDAGTGVVSGLWAGFKVLVGFLLPLLVVLVPLGVGIGWLVRGNRKRKKAMMPPPPAHGPNPRTESPVRVGDAGADDPGSTSGH